MNKVETFLHFDNVFSFLVRLLEGWENSERKGKMTYSYPHFSNALAHRRRRDNRLILEL